MKYGKNIKKRSEKKGKTKSKDKRENYVIVGTCNINCKVQQTTSYD